MTHNNAKQLNVLTQESTSHLPADMMGGGGGGRRTGGKMGGTKGLVVRGVVEGDTEGQVVRWGGTEGQVVR